MLKYTVRRVIEVSDFDALVKKTYGRPYSLQQQDGCMSRGVININVSSEGEPEDYENDTVPETVNHEERGVSFTAWLERDPELPLNAEDWDGPSALPMWWRRNFYPYLDAVLTDLCKKGLIEEGEYTINIDW